MFTGIVQAAVAVRAAAKVKGELEVQLAKPAGWRLRAGKSIAVNGVCSTVRRVQAKSFSVAYMAETLKKTTMSSLRVGAAVNLEKSLRLSDAVNGHLVTGHIDTVGVITAIVHEGVSRRVTIQVPPSFRRFIARKGSVAIDGVSLTVAACGRQTFQVALISYTLEHTILGKYRRGDKVNIEVDLIARYLDNLLKKYDSTKKSSGI